MEDATNLYFVGTAGCGKSTLTAALHEWLQGQGYDSVLVNLDPGVDAVPYEPDVDIRDWVKIDEIMQEYDLGPNGAQIAAADLLAVNAKKVAKVIDEFETDFILYDTPGQMELFAFRDSSKSIIESFGRERSAICFLIDPMLAKNPNGYVSSNLLSIITSFRLSLPILTMVSKADLLSEGDIENITAWSTDYSALFNALMDEGTSAQSQVSMEFVKALETINASGAIKFASSETMSGIESIYNFLAEISSGGEDKEPH